MLACHVDDFVLCGEDRFLTEVIGEVQKTFKISSHDVSSFKYLGLNIAQSSAGIELNQNQYISNIKPIRLPSSRFTNSNAELNVDERLELKRLSGQMLWVTSQTRPDLSFEACMMSNAGKHPTIKKIQDANIALKKL